VLNNGGPAGHCGDAKGRCDSLRTGADATEFSIRRQTAEVIKHCVEGTLVAKVTSAEVPEKGDLSSFEINIQELPLLTDTVETSLGQKRVDLSTVPCPAGGAGHCIAGVILSIARSKLHFP
jgi:hypothetical protein